MASSFSKGGQHQSLTLCWQQILLAQMLHQFLCILLFQVLKLIIHIFLSLLQQQFLRVGLIPYK